MTPKFGVQEFSLYDVLAYFVPGLVLLSWTTLVFREVLPPASGGSVSPVVLWTSFFVGSYVVGHLVQAVGNFLPARPSGYAVGALGFSEDAGRRIRECIQATFGIGDAEDAASFELCDAFVQRAGCFRERDFLT
jgi:hypothetical protein